MDFKEILQKFGQEPINFIIDKFKEGYDYLLLGDDHGESKYSELIISLIPKISKLNKFNIYLELEDLVQKDIDKYLKTGNEEYFQKIIERERELVKKGYPTEERLDGIYFDIIKTSRKNKLNVVAMEKSRLDAHKLDLDEELRERDKYMSNNIKHSGLVFVGKFHLYKNLPNSISSLISLKGDKCYTIFQEVDVKRSGSETSGLTAEIDQYLDGKSIAFDFKNKDLRRIIDVLEKEAYETDGVYSPFFNPIYNECDGLIYHSC